MARLTSNRLKMSRTPVIKKELEGGVLGEANNDGTIFVDKSVKEGTPLYNEVVGHEEKHMEQMQKGELSYDDNSVNYKGKEYVRKNGKIIDPKTGKGHPEGSMKFPWEKEADKAGKEARKEGNKNNKENMYDKNSGLNMNMASPITMKSRKGYSPFTLTPEEDLKIRLANVDKNMVGMYSQESVTEPGSIVIKPGKLNAPKVTKFDPNYKDALKKEITGGLAGRKYGYLGSDVDEYEAFKLNKLYGSKEVKTEPKTTVTTSFKPEIKKIPGTDREQGPYEMGYYEARNKAASARVQERESKRNTRQYKRAEAKFDRFKEGKIPTNPATGKPFTKREYALSRTKMVDFAAPVGTRKPGKLAEQPKTEYVEPGDPGTEGLPTLKGGKITTSGTAVSDFLSSQKPQRFQGMSIPEKLKISPFTMPGFGKKK